MILPAKENRKDADRFSPFVGVKIENRAPLGHVTDALTKVRPQAALQGRIAKPFHIGFDLANAPLRHGKSRFRILAEPLGRRD
ncbi:hypothetical protein [Pseudoruegeria sp. SHC-113]|uniref:hypothetical protein n=1 Tax=Pseudoruegeria sp. SHC-113 TaxID=2855439 RepID=UPI0021BA6676|nr:hypothetical protein [Pseudoruegeria sp. SHC-113]MCT8161829.1 hypothetical protein [Pseudoruegeria sp. SHC-113]